MDFFQASLGRNPSLIWKSIWATGAVLIRGWCWRIGNGEKVLINDDAWLPGNVHFKLFYPIPHLQNSYVSQLIDHSSREWKTEVINGTFHTADAKRILSIPLAWTPVNDALAWGGEGYGVFSVRSAYKLLQHGLYAPNTNDLQNDYNKFYRLLWGLNIPSKIKMVVWKLSWNFLPTLVNLHARNLVQNCRCPRCGEEEESTDHIFRRCLVSIEM